MACRTNQLGSIVSTSRETLNEGKVTPSAIINAVTEFIWGMSVEAGSVSDRRSFG